MTERNHDVWKNDGDFGSAVCECLSGWGLDMIRDDEMHDLYDLWLAGRRTTPDRDSIIEECAKVCEAWSASIDTGKKRNRVVGAAMQGALTCAEAIRQTKTAPNGEKS
ncbi:hypothetical protein [Burkholderia sp. BCC0405]|uniref:hypothetical protein n=1 Tax=Burkholderia sp. BCC0405 TaxID=2676298 RepID=UPI00158BB728|nr:hypothetical protein [Burkholderia sp. BCC0405]